MILDVILDALFGLAGPSWPGRGSRTRMPSGPPESRPLPWRLAVCVSVIAEAIPLLVGAWAVFGFALDASKDDFLFIVGAIMLVAALVVAGIAVAAALAALAVVRSVLACRAGSRGLAVAAGVAGLAIGLVLLASGVVETEVLWLACAGALTTSLGILAPAVEGAGEPPLI